MKKRVSNTPAEKRRLITVGVQNHRDWLKAFSDAASLVEVTLLMPDCGGNYLSHSDDRPTPAKQRAALQLVQRIFEQNRDIHAKALKELAP